MKADREKNPRLKTCKSCGDEFQALRPLQSVCGVACAVKLAREKQEKAIQKARKAETKAAKEKLRSRADYLKECQQAFNAWVRERDYSEPCISCGRHHTGQYHAGHYLTVGAHPELRFEPMNCWKQCAPCNNHLSGNIIEYRKALIAKIGADKIEWLEGRHEPKKYTIDEIKQLTAHYRAEARRLAKSRQEGES